MATSVDLQARTGVEQVLGPGAPMSPAKRRVPAKRMGFWASMASRPTSDLIVLGLTAVVALSVVAVVIAMIWVKVAHPEDDASELGRQVGQFISSLIAVIVGYVAGRGVNTASPGEQRAEPDTLIKGTGPPPPVQMRKDLP